MKISNIYNIYTISRKGFSYLIQTLFLSPLQRHYIYQFKGYFNNKNIRIYKSGILHIYKVFLYISYLLVIGSEVIYNCPDPSKNSLRYRHCASNNLCFTFLEFYPSIQYSLLLLVLLLLFSTVIYSSRKFSSLGNFGKFSPFSDT